MGNSPQYASLEPSREIILVTKCEEQLDNTFLITDQNNLTYVSDIKLSRHVICVISVVETDVRSIVDVGLSQINQEDFILYRIKTRKYHGMNVYKFQDNDNYFIFPRCPNFQMKLRTKYTIQYFCVPIDEPDHYVYVITKVIV